jgi:hypothetical protein
VILVGKGLLQVGSEEEVDGRWKDAKSSSGTRSTRSKTSQHPSAFAIMLHNRLALTQCKITSSVMDNGSSWGMGEGGCTRIILVGFVLPAPKSATRMRHCR